MTMKVLFVFASVLAIAACSKDKDPNQGLPPATEWQAPNAGGPQHAPAAAGDPHAPAAAGNPHAGMAGGDPHAGMAGGDPHAGMAGGDPHAGMAAGAAPSGSSGGVDVTQLGLEAPDPERAIDPDKYLKGTIKPSAALKAKIAPDAVIFLSVKRADPSTGAATGAPLAVERLPQTGWPMWFNLTEANAMVKGTAFSGDVVITAWADHDHDAISKAPGDVVGEARATIPAKDIDVTLDRLIE
jgi:hypothetical protein